MIIMQNVLPVGILLPESLLHTHWFNVLAAFIAINTLIYVVLAVLKTLPKIRLRRRAPANRRSETRSIYPDEPARPKRGRHTLARLGDQNR